MVPPISVCEKFLDSVLLDLGRGLRNRRVLTTQITGNVGSINVNMDLGINENFIGSHGKSDLGWNNKFTYVPYTYLLLCKAAAH